MRVNSHNGSAGFHGVENALLGFLVSYFMFFFLLFMSPYSEARPIAISYIYFFLLNMILVHFFIGLGSKKFTDFFRGSGSMNS